MTTVVIRMVSWRAGSTMRKHLLKALTRMFLRLCEHPRQGGSFEPEQLGSTQEVAHAMAKCRDFK